MKQCNIGKRCLSLLLLLSILLGLLPTVVLPKAQAASAVTRAQVESALNTLAKPVPMNRKVDLAFTSDSAQHDAAAEQFQALEGPYLIVNAQPATNGKYYVMNPITAGGNPTYPGTFPATYVTLSGDGVIGADRKLAATFEWCGFTDRGNGTFFPWSETTTHTARTAFYVSFYDGKNLKFYNDGTGIRRNAGKNTTVNLYLNYATGQLYMYYNDGDVMNYGMELDVSASSYPHYELSETNNWYELALYQILDNRVNTEPLYNALVKVKDYVSREDEYEASTYQAMLDCIYEAVQTYKLYNGEDQPTGTNISLVDKELAVLADKLQSYTMELTDYIDIPLEAYDFRGDGFAFQARYTFGAPYSLSNTSPTVKDENGEDLLPPGTFREGENYDPDAGKLQFYMEGLIEDQLVDDRIVYTQEVIRYLAMGIWTQEDFHTPSSFNSQWNSVFLTFAQNLDRTDTANIGSYDATIKKTDTEKKGGILLWENVKTAYDLAYYMFQGIWFKAPEVEGNVLETGTTKTGKTIPLYYNTQIEEFSKLRLIATGTGSYRFTSGKGYNYNKSEGYIYNDFVSRRGGYPSFNIAAGLGFESEDMFGVGTTGLNKTTTDNTGDINTDKYFPNGNYYYVFHASSSFIYYKDQDLFFQFVGDDDVYFFINDSLVCDIGGVHGSPQRTIYLEKVDETTGKTLAQTIGLKDGDICSFDMFFADRALDSINLTFDTNIKMLDKTVDTTKNHYDAATGTLLKDEAAVTTGTPIAYSFEMLNHLELGVTDLSFDDESLGVHFSKSEIDLNGTVDPSDLVVTYTTCDKYTGELCTQTPVEWSYADFREELYKATFEPTTTVNPLPTGVYRVKLDEGQELTQLKDLLEVGLPANTRIQIYGMIRNATAGKYVNTLTSGCYPLDLNDNMGDLITGNATRTISAWDLGDVQIHDAVDLVMDYSKPVRFAPKEITKYIDYDPSLNVLSYVGLKLDEENGAAYPTIPSNLYCTVEKPTILGRQGVFQKAGDAIEFTLDGLMGAIERCYVIYSVAYCNAPEDIVWYVALEVNLIPANMMYYEAERLAGDVLQYEEKVSGSTTLNQEWSLKTDDQVGTSDVTKLSQWQKTAQEGQDTNVVGEGKAENSTDSFLLFSFDNNAASLERYDSYIYGGNGNGITDDKNFDSNNIWGYNSSRNTKPTIQDGYFNSEFQLDLDKVSGYEYWFQNDWGYILHYMPTERDCVKLRLRIDNMTGTTTAQKFKISLRYYYYEGTKLTSGAEARSYSIADYVDKGFFTFEYTLGNANYSSFAKKNREIVAVRLELKDLKEVEAGGGSLSMDYLYMGPTEYANLIETEDMLINFDNSDASKMHYAMNSTYAGLNYGTANWCVNTDRAYVPVYDEKAGTLLCYTKPTDNDAVYIQSSAKLNSGLCLNYIPETTEVMQVRFKMERFSAVSNTPIFILYSYSAETDKTDSIELGRVNFSKDYLSSGEYLTLTMSLSAAKKAALLKKNKVTAFRFQISNAESKSKDLAECGLITFDYIYVGSYENLPQPSAYGYDTSYEDDTGLSDGHSLFIMGSGINLGNVQAYTQASFQFKGTGFDLISRTGAAQGAIRVEVKSADGTVEKRITVLNKGELELSQIPVVSVQGLTYGDHIVTIGVNKAINNSGTVNGVDLSLLNRGAEFYLDAIRIYDPIGVGHENYTEALCAYEADQESYPYVKEIRDALLSAADYDSATSSISGAVFLDESKNNSGSHTTSTVSTYENYGPKNEVYLDGGQAVAVKITFNTAELPERLDLGLKTVSGGQGTIKVGVGKSISSGVTLAQAVDSMTNLTIDVTSSSAQYFSLPFTGYQVGSDEALPYVYLVIYNSSTAVSGYTEVVSVTDIKAAYSGNPNGRSIHTEPLSFTVDARTVAIAEAWIDAMKRELPLADSEAKLMHSLNLASDISLNYVVAKAALENYEEIFLRCDIPQWNGTELTGYERVTLLPEEKGEYWYFTLEGLTAVQMNDVICAVLYAEKDGISYYSETDEYSIAQYAYSQLAKEGIPDSLKRLCADLLRYGSAAQSYKGYRTDSLADGAMTEEQKTYLTDLEAVTFGNTNVNLHDLENPSVTWAGKSLDLQSKVAVKYVFRVENYAGDLNSLSLHVSYTDLSGNVVNVVITDLETYSAENRLYAFSFSGLLAAELRTVLSAQVYEGQNPVSATVQYSLDTYGNDKTGALGTLCRALFAYSDSGMAYFTAG